MRSTVQLKTESIVGIASVQTISHTKGGDHEGGLVPAPEMGRGCLCGTAVAWQVPQKSLTWNGSSGSKIRKRYQSP